MIYYYLGCHHRSNSFRGLLRNEFVGRGGHTYINWITFFKLYAIQHEYVKFLFENSVDDEKIFTVSKSIIVEFSLFMENAS